MKNISPLGIPFPDTLEGQKAQAKNNEHIRVKGFLSFTNYHVIRKLVDGTDVPSNINTYRTAVFAALDQRITTINACTTIDQLEDLYAVESPELGRSFSNSGFSASDFPDYPDPVEG